MIRGTESWQYHDRQSSTYSTCRQKQTGGGYDSADNDYMQKSTCVARSFLPSQLSREIGGGEGEGEGGAEQRGDKTDCVIYSPAESAPSIDAQLPHL